MPEYIQDYFLRAFKRFGGEYVGDGDTYRIKSVPFELRKLNEDYDFQSRYGKVERTYAKITFDKVAAKAHASYEYVAPGHPLLEAVNQKAIDSMGHADAVAVFGDETNVMEGVVWFIESELTDGLGAIAGKRIFCVYQNMKGELRKINPSVIWDIAPADDVMLNESMKRMLNKKEVEEYVVTEIMFPYREEIEARRTKESEIKRKYGLRSLDFLLQESNDKLLHYQQQELEEGKDMKIAIINEERRKEDLEDKRKKLVDEIELEKQLTVSEHKFIGAAAVIPMNRITQVSEKGGVDMKPDARIEQVGMDVSMAYEKDNGWNPEDVHTGNHGFDIRAIKYGEDGDLEDIRYIEVKARAQEGGVRISANEWKKAKRFQDKFWLYVVTFAGTSQPNLERIQNPAKTFTVDEDIYATGYVIPKDKLTAGVG